MISIIRRLVWFWKADRIGPDILSTHFLLFFPKLGRWLCEKKMMHFGEGSEFRPYAFAILARNIWIGDRVVIRPGTILNAGPGPEATIRIEDDAAIGPNVYMFCVPHKFDRTDVPIGLQGDGPGSPIVVRRGAWIGAGACILEGVEIGENAVVGAGAVVTRSVPAYSVAVGVPAKVIKQFKK